MKAHQIVAHLIESDPDDVGDLKAYLHTSYRTEPAHGLENYWHVYDASNRYCGVVTYDPHGDYPPALRKAFPNKAKVYAKTPWMASSSREPTSGHYRTKYAAIQALLNGTASRSSDDAWTIHRATPGMFSRGDLPEAAQSKLPKGYRVTIRPENGMWFGRVWLNGSFRAETNTLFNTRDDAREAANKLAWDYAKTDQLHESGPRISTLRGQRRPLTPAEKREANGAPIQKSVVNGKTWFWSATHRCYAAEKTLKAALKSYRDTVEPSG